MAPPSDSVSIDDDDDELTQEIEAQVNEWSSNGSDCLNVRLVRDDGSVVSSFKPEFTYAMFGEEEAIFGYQDLCVTLTFRAYDMSPKVQINYGKLFPAQGDVRPTDIREALREFLPAAAFSEDVPDAETDFRPPGTKIHEYRRGEKSYQTWCASLSDPRARRLLENMQILVPFMIDGGSMLELDWDWTTRRWKLFVVYEVDHAVSGASSYSLIGYGTSYRIFTFPERQKTIQFDDFSPTSQSLEHFLPSSLEGQTNQLSHPPDIDSPLDLPSRERLSQFLVLPTFHGAGHGQELYKVMYKYLTEPERVRELTVEDPNERFDDLRDFCDLLHLRANSAEFSALRINTDLPQQRLAPTAAIPVDLIVSAGARKQIMRDFKIMPRQFDRLVEMHTLSFIPHQHRNRSRITRKEKSSNQGDKAYYLWRLYAKQRLYIFNKDQLTQVEHAERVEKLEAALDSVIEAYADMIERVEAREQAIADGEMEDQTDSSFTKRKRPVVLDDEDDEEAGAEQVDTSPSTNGHKKARVQ